MFWTDLDRMGWNWDPYREMRRLRRQMNRLMDGYSVRRAGEFPAVNVWASADKMILTSELPGMNTDDLDISIQGNSLTLKGTRQPDEYKEGDVFHRQERLSGSFSRTLQLPFEVDAAKAKACLERGVLQLTLPRSEKEKPKKISVKSES